MTAARAALVTVSLAGWLANPANAADEPVQKSPEPYEFVRTLNAMQDQTGVGNRSAHLAQRPLIRRIGEEMGKAPAEAWKDPKNSRALVAYVLSGGEPDALKRLMDDKVELAGVDPNLAAAAIAFAERRSEEARALLSKINPRELQPSLAAHVALVQGIVYADREPEEAIKRFELARLFAPGSLVEQGALRRQTVVVGKLGRWHEAEKLAAQYLRRFGHAVYAPSFYRELVEQLASEPDSRDDDQFARLVTLFNLLGEKERRKTYLLLAERAVLEGKVKMARFAAARASELYDTGSTERARLQVYGAAANVASDKTSDGITALQGLDRSKLGARDSLLADAALEVGEDVRREPPPAAELASQAADANAQPEAGDLDQVSPVADLARKSIVKADELLKAVSK